MAAIEDGIPRNLKSIDWDEFEKLCIIQATEEEIAAWFNMSADLVNDRVKEKYGCTFSELSRQKRGKGKISLRRKQFQKALAGDTTLLIWLGKNMLGQSDKNEISIPRAEINLKYKT